MPLNFFGALCIVLVPLIFLPQSEGSALSIFEQKKYKKLTDAQGLYSSKDDVEILGSDNFKYEIYGSGRAWLVEFYNSWCGFCQRFAPSWKALATDVKEWRGLVGIGAVDCSNDENNHLCRDFEIMAYPTIRYFHENYQEGPTNLGQNIQAGSDINEHRQKLIDIIQREQHEGRGKMYPSILPYNHTNLYSVFDGAPNAVKYAFMIIQNPLDFIGQEIALDFNKIKGVIVKYAFNNNSELIDVLGTSNIPAMFSVERDGTFHNLTSPLSRDTCKAKIRQFLKSKLIVVSGDADKQTSLEKQLDLNVLEMKEFMQERELKALKEKINKMGDVVFQMDLEGTLRYSLKHEVGNSKSITGEKLKALSAYVNILENYFPFGKYGQLFLRELKDFLSHKTFIDGNDIRLLVEDAERGERQVFSTPSNWLACKGSQSRYRGYPCGLWKMFHYLTINAADYSIGTRGNNPKSVLEAMHGYIKYFFGCAECSKHFQKMSERRQIFNVSSWDDSILWLWNAHNEVNKRLSGDQTEDPEYPKYQFPSVDKCPRCHGKDNSWNIPEVLQYLKHVYSSINVRYIGSDTRILHLGLNGASLYKSEPSVFQTIDTSMCFILYVSSFLLIVVLIRMFLRRGYRKKLYAHDLLGKV